MIEVAVDWPIGRVLLTWVARGEIDQTPVTAAHCFLFHRDCILVVRHEKRGLCIPGGHLDPDERPESALARELLEEACVTAVATELLGAVQVDHTANPRFHPGGQYPLRALQLMYAGVAANLLPFQARHETVAREFVPYEELPTVHHEWNVVLQASFDEALRVHARSPTPIRPPVVNRH